MLLVLALFSAFLVRSVRARFIALWSQLTAVFFITLGLSLGWGSGLNTIELLLLTSVAAGLIMAAANLRKISIRTIKSEELVFGLSCGFYSLLTMVAMLSLMHLPISTSDIPFLLKLFALGVMLLIASLVFRRGLTALQNILLEATRQQRSSRRREAEVRRIIEKARDAVVLFNGEGIVQSINPAGTAMFGAPQAEICGRSIERLLPRIRGEEDEFFVALCIIMESTGDQDKHVAMKARRVGGEEFSATLSIGEIEEGTLFVAIIRDVSVVEAAKNQLEDALQQRTALLEEVHHRVKNNLQIISSIISLQQRAIENEQAKKVLEECKNRIYSISSLHETLYQSKEFANIDMGAYLSAMAEEFRNLYAAKIEGLRVTVDCSEAKLKIQEALSCGLIVNELISNAVKHGFASDQIEHPELNVSLLQLGSNSRLRLCVTDNGVGMSPDETKNTASVGLRLIETLSKQLGGEMNFASGPRGTEVSIEFSV